MQNRRFQSAWWRSKRLEKMKDAIEHFWRSFRDSAWLLLICTLIFYALEDSDTFRSLELNAYMPVMFYV